jgi:hypothetical protein
LACTFLPDKFVDLWVVLLERCYHALVSP